MGVSIFAMTDNQAGLLVSEVWSCTNTKTKIKSSKKISALDMVIFPIRLYLFFLATFASLRQAVCLISLPTEHAKSLNFHPASQNVNDSSYSPFCRLARMDPGAAMSIESGLELDFEGWRGALSFLRIYDMLASFFFLFCMTSVRGYCTCLIPPILYTEETREFNTMKFNKFFAVRRSQMSVPLLLQHRFLESLPKPV